MMFKRSLLKLYSTTTQTPITTTTTGPSTLSAYRDSLVHNYEVMWRLAGRIPQYNFREHTLRRLSEQCRQHIQESPSVSSPERISKTKAIAGLKAWLDHHVDPVDEASLEKVRLAVEQSTRDLEQLKRIQKITRLYYAPDQDELVIEKKETIGE